MKIAIISDTHDVLSETALRQLKGVDAILHAGDIVRRIIMDEMMRIAPVTAVLGNCDTFEWDNKLPEYAAITLGGHRIFMIHKLPEGNPNNLPGKLYKAWTKFEPEIAIYGHTHRAEQHEENGILFFNPGSPTQPRGGMQPSIGILHLSPDSIVAEHIWLE